jgi:hypothetical protein
MEVPFAFFSSTLPKKYYEDCLEDMVVFHWINIILC